MTALQFATYAARESDPDALWVFFSPGDLDDRLFLMRILGECDYAAQLLAGLRVARDLPDDALTDAHPLSITAAVRVEALARPGDLEGFMVRMDMRRLDDLWLRRVWPLLAWQVVELRTQQLRKPGETLQ